jgi:hypothetical protein
MFNHKPFNSKMAELLRPVAEGNVKHMREQAAKARSAREFRYAGQIDRQASKWQHVVSSQPQGH